MHLINITKYNNLNIPSHLIKDIFITLYMFFSFIFILLILKYYNKKQLKTKIY